MKKQKGFNALELVIAMALIGIIISFIWMAISHLAGTSEPSADGTGLSFAWGQGIVNTTCENGKLIRSTKRTAVVIGDCKQ